MKTAGNPQGDRRPTKNDPTPGSAIGTDRTKHQNDLLDEALKEPFPASDPVSVAIIK